MKQLRKKKVWVTNIIIGKISIFRRKQFSHIAYAQIFASISPFYAYDKIENLFIKQKKKSKVIPFHRLNRVHKFFTQESFNFIENAVNICLQINRISLKSFFSLFLSFMEDIITMNEFLLSYYSILS